MDDSTMQRLFSLVFLLIFVVALSACGPIYNTEYAYVPPSSKMGKMCTAQCLQGKSSCEQICELKNENCTVRSRQDALYRYEIYKSDQVQKGQPVKKSIADFDTSYTCKAACNCKASFHTCYAACGGEVVEKKVCVAFCNQK